MNIKDKYINYRFIGMKNELNTKEKKFNLFVIIWVWNAYFENDLSNEIINFISEFQKK